MTTPERARGWIEGRNLDDDEEEEEKKSDERTDGLGSSYQPSMMDGTRRGFIVD